MSEFSVISTKYHNPALIPIVRLISSIDCINTHTKSRESLGRYVNVIMETLTIIVLENTIYSLTYGHMITMCHRLHH